MDYILELDQVSKRFPKDGFVLDRVSFSLPYGAVMGLVGQNGAGKTTAIGCILNTSSRDGGTIRLFGQEMGDQDTAIREKIGVVYDGDNFPGFDSVQPAGGPSGTAPASGRSWDIWR